jgi:uncharacterized membrane protein YGL010W
MTLTGIDALLSDYGSYHRARGNLACHAAGITLILLGTLSMLGAVRLGRLGPLNPLTAADAAVGLLVLFYLALDLPLGLAMAVELVALDVLTRALGDWRAGLAAFAVGWVFQGIGHAVFEKNKPAFFENLVHLFVGPVFILNELLGLRPVAAAAK